MSLEKAIDDLRKEIVILNQNLTVLGEAKPSPYDDIPSDTEPAEEKPKSKPKPKAKKEEPKPEPEEAPAADEGPTLLVVQQKLTELSKKDRAAAKALVEDFTPAGGPAKLSAVPEKDFQALIDAVDEALQ